MKCAKITIASFVLYMLSIMVILSSCNRSVTDFQESIETSNFDEAEVLYEALAGNGTKAEQAQNFTLSYLENTLAKYINNELAYSEACAILNSINDTGIVSKDETEKGLSFLSKIEDSRISFAKGKELLNQNDYIGAINQFERVINEDENYDEAQSSLLLSKTKHKENAFEEIDNLAQDERYVEALSMLASLSDAFGNDSEIDSRIVTVETNYKNYLLNEINNYAQNKSYDAAISAANSALTVFRNDAEIIAKIDKLNKDIADEVIRNSKELIRADGNYSLALIELQQSLERHPANTYIANEIKSLENGNYYFNTTYIEKEDYGNIIFYIDNNDVAHLIGEHSIGEWSREEFQTKFQTNDVRSIYCTNVYSGDYSYFFIKTNNELWAIGDNQYGQLGDDTGLDKSEPVFIMADVANLYFDRNTLDGYYRIVYALKTDNSLWVWGENATKTGKDIYAPVKVADNHNANQELLEAHITSMNYNLESYFMIDIPDVIANALGGRENILSSIEIERDGKPERSSYYAITKDTILWGWGYNDGKLGDGTRAYRDNPVKIAENVKRLTPRYFIAKSNDWYYFADEYFNGDINGVPYVDYTPRLAYTNCLYAYSLGGSAFTDGKWYNPNGKICYAAIGGLFGTNNYEVVEMISDVKLPSIAKR